MNSHAISYSQTDNLIVDKFFGASLKFDSKRNLRLLDCTGNVLYVDKKPKLKKSFISLSHGFLEVKKLAENWS